MMGKENHLRSVSVSYPVRPMSFDSESLYDDAYTGDYGYAPDQAGEEPCQEPPPQAPWPPPPVRHFQPNLEFFKLFSAYIPSEERLVDGMSLGGDSDNR
jgi:hypothetical protein